MTTLRVDLAGLLGNAARTIRQPDEVYGEMTAFGLEEVAKHGEMVRSGEATLAEFCDLYCLPLDDAMAAELRRVTEERDRLRDALGDLLAACEADCGGPDTGDFGDDEAVAFVEGDGDCALTFGHMRRARAALAIGEPYDSATEQAATVRRAALGEPR